ncbi:YuzB family protein [Longirhabdus pacifica]|uniref:YuzB family protein n=1 Tax=Longirhabdus pacifica TaxID=2305227 RepID=UPI001008B51C|nr:YuzB family protein [Longirhabdus pacifica]
MRAIIEFCSNNFHHGTDKVMEKLEGNPEIDTIEYGCLDQCGQCSLEPFALVDGKVIRAATADELYEKIMTAIEETSDVSSPFDELLD